MLKLIIGLVVLGVVLFFLMSKGGEIDMGGEKHGAGQPGAGPRALLTMTT
ncbi:MAG: hypothetical protein QM772_13875 [Ottowia sp.]